MYYIEGFVPCETDKNEKHLELLPIQYYLLQRKMFRLMANCMYTIKNLQDNKVMSKIYNMIFQKENYIYFLMIQIQGFVY